ncbi:MAG: phosphate ABC transporter permease PstA [SAR202 cluster bacterium]|nr:phosphate ABC transporter permease PstA [SAR202 cluster bacterium]|tara:strand:- start:2482 stop:3366 length:885 start_codon:yes stop_codon:yes gene_type:complete
MYFDKGTKFNRRINKRKTVGAVLNIALIIALTIALIGLIVLLAEVLIKGLPWVSKNLIFNYPSRHPEQAGLLSALMGTVWVMACTAIISIPIGIGAAVYLEEYAPKNWITKLIEVNISNLAGVPSIVYGLLGLALFVQVLALGRSVLAGALTMSLLILPIIILTSREAIKSIPITYREAAFALGATRWEVVSNIILPSAFPGILTGTILAMSRAIGESAPMIAISALVYLTFVPSGPMDRFTVLPIQIFNWVARPQEGFRGIAAGGIVILLAVLFLMNAIAVYLRIKYQRRSNE